MSANSFDLKRLRDSIRPLRLHWFSRLRSTNDHAAAMRRRHELFAPAVVVTGAQVAGRGRNSNSWWSSDGCITVTLVVAAQEHISLHQLPLIAGVALRNAVARITGANGIELKWPNDLMFAGRKLAGLLCERVQRADLIGIGLNVNVAVADIPPPLRGRITSLSQITRTQHNKTDVLISIVRCLHAVLSRPHEHPFGSILREYDQHDCLRGRRVSVWINRDAQPIRGTCLGLDSHGRLLVRQRAKQLRIVAGQVQMR